MPTTYESANINASLIGARRPKWTDLLTPTGTDLSAAPDTSADGVLCEDALVTHVHVATRENAGRTAYVTIDTLDATATYRVTVQGTDYTYDASSGDGAAATILTGIRDAINAGSLATATVHDASADDPTPGGRTIGADAVKVVCDTEGLCSYEVGANGTGVLAIVADAEGATVQPYVLHKARTNSTAPVTWVKLGDPVYVPPQGKAWTVKTGGIDRLFLRTLQGRNVEDGSTLTTTALVSVGPALSEGG